MKIFDNKIIAHIRKHSLTIEKQGAITQEMLRFIYKHRLFKLFVPEELGGKMLPLPDALKIFEDASGINGSFGWLVTIGSGGGYFTSFIEQPVCKKLFSGKKAVVAGSGHPSGVARKVRNGYLVSGQWKYCSGANYATMFTANCMIKADHQANPKMKAFIFSPEQVTVLNDWNAFGLKATESHSIKVKDVFVPESMTFNLTVSHRNYNYPVYQYPFLRFAEASFAAVSIGICKHFIEEAKKIADQNKIAWNASSPPRFRFVRGKIEKTENTFLKTVDDYYDTVNESWRRHLKGKSLTENYQNNISNQFRQTSRVALNTAQIIFPYLGMNAIMENSLINQIWRDLHTTCQHILLVPFTKE